MVEKLDLISLKLAPIHVIYTLVFLLTFVNVMDKKLHIRYKIKHLFHIFSFSTVKKPLVDFPTFTTINWRTPFFGRQMNVFFEHGIVRTKNYDISYCAMKKR